MLTPREYAFADVVTSLKMGLPGRRHGLLFCDNEDGAHWTLVTDDVEYAQLLRDSPPAVLAALEIPEGKFAIKREGWPDEW